MESEQTQSNYLIDFLAWLEVNKRRLITGGVVLVVLWLAVYTYTYFKGQQELTAEEAMSAVFKAPLGNPSRSLPDASLLMSVAERHAGSPAGQRALLLAAGALYQQGKFAEAKEKFQKFAGQHAGSSLVPIANYGMAACEDALGNLDSALSGYQAVEQRDPRDPLAPQAKLAMAVIQEARNKPEETLKIYDQLAKAETRSMWASEAFSRREMLVAKFPNLVVPPPSAPVSVAGTNAPVVVRTNTGSAVPSATNVVIRPPMTTVVSNAAAPLVQVVKSNVAAAVSITATNAPVVPGVPAPKKP